MSVSRVAFLVAPETVSPLTPGSALVIFNSTIAGGLTEIGCPSHKIISQTSCPTKNFLHFPFVKNLFQFDQR